MKRLSTIAAMAIIAASALCAQNADRKALTQAEREEWLSEMRSYKREFLARELELTQEQQAQFFQIYEQMDDELNQVAAETRELEAKVADDDTASDTEMEAAARALFEQKSREGKIEIEYFDKYKEILEPKQLLRLKNAERKFTQQLVRQHGKAKATMMRKKQ